MYAATIFAAGIQYAITRQQPHEAAVQLFGSTHDPALIAVFALLATVAAPIVEESVFRGFLFNALLRHAPVWGGRRPQRLALRTLAPLAQRVAPLACSGIVLAYVYHTSGSLTASMLTHALFNALNLVALASRPHMIRGSRSMRSTCAPTNVGWGDVFRGILPDPRRARNAGRCSLRQSRRRCTCWRRKYPPRPGIRPARQRGDRRALRRGVVSLERAALPLRGARVGDDLRRLRLAFSGARPDRSPARAGADPARGARCRGAGDDFGVVARRAVGALSH